MSTYDMIIKNRKQNKVGVQSQKTNPIFKRVKLINEVDIHRPSGDDSRDAINGSLDRSYNSHRAEEVTDRKVKQGDQIDPTKDSGSNHGPRDQDTSSKNKIMLETKEDSITKQNEGASSNSLKSDPKLQTTKPVAKLPKDPLKEDEGSFVLSKPVHKEDSKDLAARMEELPHPTLTPPVLDSGRRALEDGSPGDWTLREQNKDP